MGNRKQAGEGGARQKGVVSPPSPATYNPHKSVRIPQSIEHLFAWIANKRRRDERVNTIHQECAIMGAYVLAASQLPDSDGTYGGFTSAELVNHMIVHVKSAADFCEQHGFPLQNLPPGVGERLEELQQTTTRLLSQVTNLTTELHRSETLLTRFLDAGTHHQSGVSRENTDEVQISRQSIQGSAEVASRWGGEENISL